MKRVGFIDARRPVVGGIPGWTHVPGMLIPGQLQGYGIYEEFLGYVLSNAEPSIPGWLCANQATVLSISAYRGGVVALSTGGADEDFGQMQLGDGVGGAFFPGVDPVNKLIKEIWFEALVKQTIAGGTTLNLAFGLVAPAGAGEILADGGGAALADNRLYFVTRDDGTASAWTFEGDKAGTTDPNLLGIALESLKWHTYGFHVHGIDGAGLLPAQCDVYYDRALVAAGQVTTLSIPTACLTPFVCIKTGDNVAEAVYVDYIMCIQQR